MHNIYKTIADILKCLDIIPDMPVAVACSGGADSMSLTLIIAGWAKANNRAIIALTVDHGLRKESQEEARQVGKWLKKRGIAHAILSWKGKKPVRNIQEAARKTRYRLLADYCKTHHIPYLLVAHHLEDQAETFLLRLARGSGVDGLSAMSALTSLYGIQIVRPLLDIPKTELLAYLKACKQPYISDPSNENTAYDRVKMRSLLPMLAKAGLTPERIALAAKNMARARKHLESETSDFLDRACDFFPEGYALLHALPESEEIALRALAKLLMAISGSETKPRLEELERLYNAIKNPAFKAATLGGAVFSLHKKSVLIYREQQNIAAPIAIRAGKEIGWDNRFMITHANAASTTFFVGALTQEGWLSIARKHKLCNPFPVKKILYTLPAIRDTKGTIVAVPHMGFGQQKIQISHSVQANWPG